MHIKNLVCFVTRRALKTTGLYSAFRSIDIRRTRREGSPVDPPRLLVVCYFSTADRVWRATTFGSYYMQIRAIKHILRCLSSSLCPVIHGSVEIFAGRSPSTTTTCPRARCYHDSVHAPRAFLSHILSRAYDKKRPLNTFRRFFFNNTKRSYLSRRIYEFRIDKG